MAVLAQGSTDSEAGGDGGWRICRDQCGEGVGGLPVDVTLVDRKNYHLFQPLLYQVALAVLSPADIAQPIRSILRNHKNIEVLMDEVVGFDLGAAGDAEAGARLEYDYLIVATGSTHSYFGREDWAKLAPGLKTMEDATEIRRRVLLAFELAERQMLEHGTHPPLKFVIVGGGPTGRGAGGGDQRYCQAVYDEGLSAYRSVDGAGADTGGRRRIFWRCIPPDLQQKAVEQLNALGD